MNENETIADKYIIQNKIGKGKFGTVYLAINKKTNESVAIKTESLKTSFKLLKHETTILKYLYDHGIRKIPIVFWYGIHRDHTCVSMTFYETSFYECALSNTLDVICSTSTKANNQINKFYSIMTHLINIIECIHKLYVLHRDIKPHNFMIKRGELFLIDFGFATFYVDESKKHIPIRISENIIGTPKYVSFFIHDGNLPSRRDDLLSVGYIFLFLTNRELPWDSFKKPDVIDTLDEIDIMHYKNQQRKVLKGPDYLLHYCSTIPSIKKFFEYCHRLAYHETPNYDLIRELFAETA